MAVLGWKWSYRWANPYTKPPDGKPVVVVEVYVPGADGARPDKEPQEIKDVYTPGDGYSTCLQTVETEPRRISDKARYRLRLLRLKRRCKKKTPLFWRETYQAKIEEKPEYFGKKRRGHGAQVAASTT